VLVIQFTSKITRKQHLSTLHNSHFQPGASVWGISTVTPCRQPRDLGNVRVCCPGNS